MLRWLVWILINNRIQFSQSLEHSSCQIFRILLVLLIFLIFGKRYSLAITLVSDYISSWALFLGRLRAYLLIFLTYLVFGVVFSSTWTFASSQFDQIVSFSMSYSYTELKSFYSFTFSKVQARTVFNSFFWLLLEILRHTHGPIIFSVRSLLLKKVLHAGILLNGLKMALMRKQLH